MYTKKIVVATLLSLLMAVFTTTSTVAKAQSIPKEQWVVSAQLALAQCLVGEAGWDNETEWAVITNVFVRRWQDITSTYSTRNWTIEQVIRQYCAMHRTQHPTFRHRWLRNLPWGTLQSNPGFEPSVNWRNYSHRWDTARAFVKQFLGKGVRDPLPTAKHFGGAMDNVPGNWVMLPRDIRGLNGRRAHLHNRFYAISSSYRANRVVSARRAQGSFGNNLIAENN